MRKIHYIKYYDERPAKCGLRFIGMYATHKWENVTCSVCKLYKRKMRGKK